MFISTTFQHTNMIQDELISNVTDLKVDIYNHKCFQMTNIYLFYRSSYNEYWAPLRACVGPILKATRLISIDDWKQQKYNQKFDFGFTHINCEIFRDYELNTVWTVHKQNRKRPKPRLTHTLNLLREKYIVRESVQSYEQHWVGRSNYVIYYCHYSDVCLSIEDGRWSAFPLSMIKVFTRVISSVNITAL